MIIPTVGKQVWYWPFIGQMDYNLHEQPFAATITHVFSNTMVNLSVLTETGNHLRLTSIILAKDRPALAGEASWPTQEQSKNEKFTAFARGAVAPAQD